MFSLLTCMMGVSHVKNITGVDVMIQSFLYQILGLVPCQLGHPENITTP